ncbi:hypothetical protein [Phenylobacterium kunshanense]|uniref:Uncharacterized protein n=1 Tax=Phenylobacterium kunshanense TaxID=1445034 RepID=A0A328BND9_9CAUL|nr:hypothetical protein [Phenylobacterium kunshanense]RAK68880.1 hypothetical protein DJ019_02375 [Phenylobacterium kunshanense]
MTSSSVFPPDLLADVQFARVLADLEGRLEVINRDFDAAEAATDPQVRARILARAYAATAAAHAAAAVEPRIAIVDSGGQA